MTKPAEDRSIDSWNLMDSNEIAGQILKSFKMLILDINIEEPDWRTSSLNWKVS